MHYTARALIDPRGNEARFDATCRTFSSMVRTAYNRLLEGKRTSEIVGLLRVRYDIQNARWCQWAIRRAQATIKSQKELLPLYVEMYDGKIARVKRKMERVADPLKKRGCGVRIAKLERKKMEIERHIAAGTVPRAVFGSRRLIEDLSSGKGDAEEWRRRRTAQFFSVGQANCRGNANTRILRRGDGYILEVRNWPSSDFEVGLRVPEYYQRLLDAALASGVAYSVRVRRTERNYQALISFEVDGDPPQSWNGKRVAAIDTNPEGLAVAIVASDGNFFASRWFHEPALVHARAEKRNWIAANLVKRALRWAKGYRCNTVIIEKLRFGMAIDGSHRANRAKSNFLRKKLLEFVRLRTLKIDWVCAEVNASYSSIAGDLKYSTRFSRFNRHQLAALVLGRRALGYGERLDMGQLGLLPKRRRAHAARVILSFHGHRHELLKFRCDTDGRMLGGNVKGASTVGERVTPRTATTLVLPRLSLLLGGGCPGDESGARGYGVNPPPSIGVKLGSIGKS